MISGVRLLDSELMREAGGGFPSGRSPISALDTYRTGRCISVLSDTAELSS